MDRKPRRFGCWALLGIIGLAFLLLVTGLAVWNWMGRGEVRERMDERFEALRAETASRSPARPVLRGEPEPGNAWDEYQKALKIVEPLHPLKPDNSVLGDFVARRPKADRSRVRALVVTYGEALEALSRGAWRERSRFDYDWEAGVYMNGPDMVGSLSLVSLAICRVRLLREANRTGEALGLLLDAAQFARDMAWNSPITTEMIAISHMRTVFDEILEMVRAGTLSKGELEALARGLERLDTSFPGHDDAILNEAALLIVTLRNEDREGRGGLLLNMFGAHLRVEMVDEYDRTMRRIAAAERISWAEVRRVGLEIEREVKESRSSVVALSMPMFLKASAPVRATRTRLRLVRAAVHFRLTGEDPDLEDPFGGKLRTVRRGKGIRIWSVGANGIDDGGKGSWATNQDPDLVLDLAP